MTDPINNPPHYTSSEAKCSNCNHPIECIDIAVTFDFHRGNIIKYLWRSDLKDGLDALKKAQWYLNDYIARQEDDR